jgi:hypothetical protein
MKKINSLKTDPRELGILCMICGVLISEPHVKFLRTLDKYGNINLVISEYPGMRVVCDHPECNNIQPAKQQIRGHEFVTKKVACESCDDTIEYTRKVNTGGGVPKFCGKCKRARKKTQYEKCKDLQNAKRREKCRKAAEKEFSDGVLNFIKNEKKQKTHE